MKTKTKALYTLNLKSSAVGRPNPRSNSLASRALHALIVTSIIVSFHSQVFAQKVSLQPNKKVAAKTAQTVKIKKTKIKKTAKKKQSINQQILAQAQLLDRTAEKSVQAPQAASSRSTRPVRSATRPTVAQALTPAVSGASSNVDLQDYESATVSAKWNEEKKDEAPAYKLNGAVAMTVGRDTNLDVDRAKNEGGFFEMRPSLSYEGSTLGGDFAARIKDFSDQENSAIAKETELNINVFAKFAISDDVSTKSKLSLTNSDSRWPDFIGGSLEGMPIRYFETKFTQSLDFKLDKLAVGVNGSYANRDFSNDYTDFAQDILGPTSYQRDRNDAKLDSKFDLALNKNFSVIAKPALKHTKFKDEPARQTRGEKAGQAIPTPEREILTNELALDLKMSLGPVTFTPTAAVGQDVDRALGAEDTSFNRAGASLEIVIDEGTGLKIGGSALQSIAHYDNWNFNTAGGELREDKFLQTAIGASVNLSKNVSLALDYAREEGRSNVVNGSGNPASDLTYNREIIGSTLNVSF